MRMNLCSGSALFSLLKIVAFPYVVIPGCLFAGFFSFPSSSAASVLVTFASPKHSFLTHHSSRTGFFYSLARSSLKS